MVAASTDTASGAPSTSTRSVLQTGCAVAGAGLAIDGASISLIAAGSTVVSP